MFFSSYLTQNANQTQAFSQLPPTFDSLIRWINTIEYPRCLLASQREDLNDGTVLCELINEVVLKNQQPDFLPKIKNTSPNSSDKIHNFDMALKVLQSHQEVQFPPEISKLTSNDLLNDNAKIVSILEHLYRITKMNQDTPSSKTERSLLSDQQSNINRTSNHQRQLTAEFGFKFDDIALQLPDRETSPRIIPSKPPIDPKTMFSKIAKSSHSLSQSIRQSPSRPRSNSPNKVEFQSTRETPVKDDQLHQNNSYLSSPGNSFSKKDSNCKQDSLRLSPKLDAQLSLSRISPNSDLNNSVTTVNTFFKKELSSRPASSSGKVTPSCNSTKRNMYQAPVLCLRQPQIRENSGIELTLPSSSSRYMKMKSSENLNFTLNSRQQENRSKIIAPMRARGAGTVSFAKSNSMVSTKQKGNVPEKKENMPSYASIITRSNSMSDALKSSGKKETSMLSRRQSTRDQENEQDLVTPVTPEIKTKILDWLLSINILKDSIPDLDRKLHKICKNGLIFVDLLNRLEGRQDVIKGITRDDYKMNIKINYLKITNYLQGFEKMNPRYLSAQEYLMNGDEDVFWGFLDDIYNLYHKKISPFDTRYKQNQNKMERTERTDRSQTPDARSMRQSPSMNYEKSLRLDKSGDYTRDQKVLKDSSRQDCSSLGRDRKSFVSTKDMSRTNVKFSGLNIEETKFVNYSSIRNIDKDSQFYSHRNYDTNGKENDPAKEISKGFSTPSKKLGYGESYLNIHSRKASASYSGRSSPSGVNYTKRSRALQEDLNKLFLQSESKQEDKSGKPRSRSRSQVEEEENIISVDIENEVLEWLDKQGFSSLLLKQQSSLFEDRLRNGSVLCKVIGNFEGENISPVYTQPKSIDECRYNIYTAFKVLAKKETPIPSYLKGKEEAILKGNRNILFTLLHALKKIYAERQKGEESHAFEPEATFKASNYMPPYSEQQIELLEESLMNWIRSLGLLESKLPRIKSFQGLVSHLKDGLMLCDLVSLVLQKKISPIHAKATTEPQAINNIRKALEELRKIKDIGQRFLWKDKEIYEGDRFVVLGLLEDINRYFHGLKPRSAPNYFCEEPYIPEALRDKKLATSSNQNPDLSVVNYRKYLTNIKDHQLQLGRSVTCPRTRMPQENKLFINKPIEFVVNQTGSSQRGSRQSRESPVTTFIKNGLGNRFFNDDMTNIAPELTFSSPFLEGSQLEEYIQKPIK